MLKYVATFALSAALLSAQSLPGLKSNLAESNSPTAPPAKSLLSAEQRGDILMARKNYREAVDVYREGPPGSAVLVNKIGIAFHQMMLMPQARKQYEAAIRLKPDYAEAINNLGTVFYAQKSFRKAILQYKKALRYSPNAASIYSNLGTAYFARKKYDPAFEAYQKALAFDPEVFDHRGSHGVLLQESNVAERAKFHFYLAKTYAKAGDVTRALLYMRKSLEEGFKDRERYASDSEFEALQAVPEFQELLKLEVRVL